MEALLVENRYGSKTTHPYSLARTNYSLQSLVAFPRFGDFPVVMELM